MRTAIVLLSCTLLAAVALGQCPPAGTDWCSGQYQYDAMGNIRTIGNDAYVYDTVGRLVSGTADYQRSGIYSRQDYSYDGFGNLRSVSRTAGSVGCLGACEMAYTASSVTNRINSNGAAYDVPGNLTNIDSVTYEYDGVGSLTHESTGQEDRQFVYTADDERIATRNGVSWTWTVRGLDQKILREFTSLEVSGQPTSNRQWAKDYVWRDGALLASVAPTSPGASTTTTLHYHLDHLGTPRVITEGANAVVGVHAYYPFGGELSLSQHEGSEELLKFTGHERDLLAGGDPHTLDDMHARYFMAAAGRFLSVDPVLDLKRTLPHPQMWNRYTYVTNNPMRYTDPDGRDMGFGDYASAVWEATKQTVDDVAYDTAKPGLIVMSGFINDSPKQVAAGSGLLFVEGASGGLMSANVSRLTMGFTSRANLLSHFEKHGAEFGFKMAEQYGTAASRFVATSGREGVEALTTKTGEKLIYNASTKEFAVVNKSGGIVTYFKADAKYWQKQVAKVLTEILVEATK